MPKKVLIIDQDAVRRSYIEQWIKEIGDEVVATTAMFHHGIEKLNGLDPNVNLNLIIVHGFDPWGSAGTIEEFLAGIPKRHRDCKVLILSEQSIFDSTRRGKIADINQEIKFISMLNKRAIEQSLV